MRPTKVVVLAADGFVLPCVGALGAVMSKIAKVGGDQLLKECLALGLSSFGSGVGERVLFETSTECGADAGLGIHSGLVERLGAPVVPHMGCSTAEVNSASQIMRECTTQSHSEKSTGIGFTLRKQRLEILP